MDFHLPQPVRQAISRLEQAGYSAFAVGGCVRDWVLGKAPHDYDICTSAAPDEMQAVFRGERTVETGLKHGTLTVVLSDMPLEITTFRLDGAYTDGRHPDSVRFTARVEDDLSRRDFTVNAMAYSPSRGLIDPFGGRADCEHGVIRCVGEADRRFEEDSLRLLRALRFSARLGFSIERATAAAIHAGKEGLGRISRERIAAELNALLCAPKPGNVLREYADVLWQALAAEGDFRESQGWPLALRRVDEVEPVLSLRWAALLADVMATEEIRGVLMALKQPKRLIEETGTLAYFLQEFRGVPLDRVSMQERMMRLGPKALEQLIRLERADAVARWPGRARAADDEARRRARMADELVQSNACFSPAQLAVRGGDLAALGLRGPQIGGMVETLLLAVVRGEVPNEKEALLEAARRRM